MTHTEICPRCKGTEVIEDQIKGFPMIWFDTVCTDCLGTGELIRSECDEYDYEG